MKKISRRNFLLASGVVTIGAALAACGGSSSSSTAASSAAPASSAAASAPASAEGKVLNIWCWNDEFQSRFNDYYPEVKEIAADKSTTTLKDGTTVKWTINANENNNNGFNIRETLSQLCTRKRAEGQNIIAGINTGFFDSNDGIARGPHIEDGELVYANNSSVRASLTNHAWAFTVFNDGTSSCGKKTFGGSVSGPVGKV